MTAPLAIATTSDVADFYPGTGLPTIVPTFQTISDQAVLDAIIAAAVKSGVRLRYSAQPAPPAGYSVDPLLQAALNGIYAAIPVDAATWAAAATVHPGDKIALPDGGTAVRLPSTPTTTRGVFDATENGYWQRIWFRFPWLESVPAVIVGDSYGSGGSDSDVGTTYFDRFCARHRTAAAVNRSVTGKRADEILMQQVVPNWAANTRGLVCIADVVLNDANLYPDNTNTPTTTEAFRAMLAYFTAQYVAAVADTGAVFGPGWTAGVSDGTAGRYYDVAFTGDKCYLPFTYGVSGGVATVKDTTGATLATVTTSGYAQTFTGVVKLSGFGAGNHSVRVAVTSGTLTVPAAYIVPGPTPPLILWHKPGPRNIGTDARITAYLAACATVLPDFPTVVSIPVDGFYSYTTMLGLASHPNDLYNAYAANLTERALAGVTGFVQGLNRLSTGTAAPVYTPTVPAYTAPGATAPAAPTGVTAATGNQAVVTWTRGNDGGATVTSQEIQSSPDGTTWTSVVTGLAPTVTSYTVVAGLTQGTGYYFRVRAVNSVGNGAYGTTAGTTVAGAVPTTYAADTFTRADAPSTPGSTETGSYAWAVVAGDTYGIASGQLVCLAGNAGTAPADCLIDDGHADGTISVTLPGAATESGALAFRVAAGNAAGYILYRSSGSYTVRQRTSAGAYTTLATSGLTPAVGDVLTVVLNGTSVTAKITQGATTTTFYTATLATGATNTRHGVFTALAGGCHFDNWTHTSITS